MKDLLQKLIRAESTNQTGELASATVIADYLRENGLTGEVDRWDESRANITTHIRGSGEKPALLFACHLDVVPPGEAQWQYPPFAGTEADGRIYGRGAVDMKGSTAALLAAAAQLKKSAAELKGDIIITATAGEETDSCGARRFISQNHDKLPKLAGVIIAEPTNFEVITAHRGLLWLELITKGKTAHGSMPQLGINAINSMRLLLDEVEKIDLGDIEHPQLGKCSLSINTIAAGNAVNVIPDMCSTGLDIRTVPGKSHSDIIATIEGVFTKLKKSNPDFDAEIKIIRDVKALESDNDSDFVKEFCQTVEVDKTITADFCTDGPFFTGLGVPIIIYGPGHGELCHKPDEYIEIKDLQTAVEKFTEIMKKFIL